MSYKETLNLPKTDFPMKANLPVRENQYLELWKEMDLYQLVRDKSKGKPPYVLHDGPPFANGNIHLGHVLNKTLKDIVVRYKTMKGFDSPYIPGWDCHGLPIEHQVVKKLKSNDRDPIKIRQESEAYARKFIDVQREQFKRIGVMGDWDHPYITMEPKYEAEILRVFGKLVEKGLVYQGLRPVYWSTGCRTALAEAEIEYQDRTDISVYVKFPLLDSKETKQIQTHAKLPDAKIHLIVWTTTPWTLPANLAVACHPDLTYVYAHDGEDIYLFAKDRQSDIEKAIVSSAEEAKTLTSVQEVQGKDLEKLKYQHPFLNREGEVHPADFVTQDSGSGLVHIAPGHGHDDYQLGQKVGLELLSPVDDAGRLTEESGLPDMVGDYVFEANSKIVGLLKSKHSLLADESITHSYPHCWRSKTPIIFRSVKQWFIRVQDFRDQALGLIDQVTWVPDWGKNRIVGSVSTRQDWCISRQRTWGVPLPVFYNDKNEPVLDAKTVYAFSDLVEKDGTNLWFAKDDDSMAKALGLPTGMKKGFDTLDVWIDSGSSFQAVSQKEHKFPADLYLEGSDQHRGWFQSSLLLSCAATGDKPFESVLTHGFVVDGQGKKMSKSQGNVVSPDDIMKTLGGDILRLWVVSADYSVDVRASKDIFSRISDAYRKIRNTFRYLLGNLHGFDPAKDSLEEKDLLEIDRWASMKLNALIEKATESYDQFHYHRFYQDIYNFCIFEMSSVYLDVLKDRLYVDAKDSLSGRSARTVLFRILHTLVRLLAPVMPFTCEEVWQAMGDFEGKEKSVHLADWPESTGAKQDDSLEKKWDKLIHFRDDVLKALEEKREKKEIGNSLEAEVELTVLSESDYTFFEKEKDLIQSFLLVSKFAVSQGNGQQANSNALVVKRSSGKKCSRCWIYFDDLSDDSQYADLCRRCFEVVKTKNEKV